MKQYNPTTPGRRQMTSPSYHVLSRISPFKPLLKRVQRASGRNNQGRITTRHQGGGHKKLYRMVDFGEEKLGKNGVVLTLEYDPYRTAFIALVLWADGSRRYILAPHNLNVGDNIEIKESGALKVGNRMKLKSIPVGYKIYNIEVQSGKGGQLARSAGSWAEVLSQDSNYTHIKLSSGSIRKVPWENFASLGQVSNIENNLVVIGKAGRSRWMGVRPTVRGSVMNPVDHPYGGGEGRTQRGTRKPKTLWGKVTGGHKTRNKKKWSRNLIVQRRK